MRRRFLLFSVAHAVLTMALLLFAFSSAMGSFDDASGSQPLAARVAGTVAGALMHPGALLWTRRVSENVPNWMEMALFLLNSTLWGFAAAALFGWLRRNPRTR